jgi:hypothetical protein
LVYSKERVLLVFTLKNEAALKLALGSCSLLWLWLSLALGSCSGGEYRLLFLLYPHSLELLSSVKPYE